MMARMDTIHIDIGLQRCAIKPCVNVENNLGINLGANIFTPITVLLVVIFTLFF